MPNDSARVESKKTWHPALPNNPDAAHNNYDDAYRIMLLNWLDIRLARLGFWIAWCAITVLALIPAHDVPASSGWDKLDHWLAFFTLAALADRLFAAQRFWRRTALLLLAYGIGIEIAQYFTPDRQADAMDVVADSIGIIIYGLLHQLLLVMSPRTE